MSFQSVMEFITSLFSIYATKDILAKHPKISLALEKINSKYSTLHVLLAKLSERDFLLKFSILCRNIGFFFLIVVLFCWYIIDYRTALLGKLLIIPFYFYFSIQWGLNHKVTIKDGLKKNIKFFFLPILLLGMDYLSGTNFISNFSLETLRIFEIKNDFLVNHTLGNLIICYIILATLFTFYYIGMWFISLPFIIISLIIASVILIVAKFVDLSAPENKLEQMLWILLGIPSTAIYLIYKCFFQ